MRIEEMESDGNCLFRAVAYQVYGEQDMCYLLRERCMEYVLASRDYFKDFIDTTIDGSIELYCQRKSQDKVWGDDLEIEALSEIYGRPIEIYAYSSEPMRTFHEQADENQAQQPIRISYHGRNHYNAVVRQDFHPDRDKYTKSLPGDLENQALQMAQEQATTNCGATSAQEEVKSSSE